MSSLSEPLQWNRALMESPVLMSVMWTLIMKTPCTWAKSNKMQQIAQNKEVAFAVCFEGISGNGIGENLGWVLDPKNAEIRAKLRKAFIDWYYQANNEQDENCVILAICITRGTIFRDHGAVRYNMDFVNKVKTEEGEIK